MKSISELQQYSQQFGIQIQYKMSSLSSHSDLRSPVFSYTARQKLHSRVTNKISKNNEQSNDSYYETNNQQYRNVMDKNSKNNEDMSELSILIYQGLDKARKQVKEQKIVNMLTEIYKKQLQIQIDLCKEMEGLTMATILNQKQIQIIDHIQKMEGEVKKLKEELQEFERKNINANNTRHILSDQLNSKQSSYKIYRSSCGKMERPLYNRQYQQNINLNTSDQEHSENESKFYLSTKNIHYENSSTNPSYGSSFLSGPLYKNSHEVSYHTEKKNLLLRRLNLMKDQIEQIQTGYLKRQEMTLCEIQILKKQIILVDEALEKYQNINEKRRQVTPTRTHVRQCLDSEKKRSPRLKSFGNFQKSSKKPLFKYAKKPTKPSMFAIAKQASNSPLLKRHASQNKMSQLCFGPKKLQSTGSKFIKIKSNVVNDCREEENEYYSSRGIPHLEKHISLNRIKNNCYY